MRVTAGLMAHASCVCVSHSPPSIFDNVFARLIPLCAGCIQEDGRIFYPCSESLHYHKSTLLQARNADFHRYHFFHFKLKSSSLSCEIVCFIHSSVLSMCFTCNTQRHHDYSTVDLCVGFDAPVNEIGC